MSEQDKQEESQLPNAFGESKRYPFPELLTAEDMCVIFGISRNTLRDWCANKGLPHIRLGLKTFFTESRVWEWLRSREKGPQS